MDTGNPVFLVEDEILKVCANIIGARDEYTQGHSHHVHAIAKVIAETGRFAVDRRKLSHAALLHDIGKILVPRSVLNATGALSDADWRELRNHPRLGHELLLGTCFEDIADGVLHHHERMDGKGYHGLAGEAIPLAARIIAVADTFSALRTYRCYRPQKSLAETMRIMREISGTQLDAAVVEALFSYPEEFLENLQCNCAICARRREEEAARQEEEKRLAAVPRPGSGAYGRLDFSRAPA